MKTPIFFYLPPGSDEPIPVFHTGESVVRAEQSEPLPEHCLVCNHHNPYVGKEHMSQTTSGTVYVCRTCKPGWDRSVRLQVLKDEAELREQEKNRYGS